VLDDVVEMKPATSRFVTDWPRRARTSAKVSVERVRRVN
jgi:uncharacterized lipoprotein